MKEYFFPMFKENTNICPASVLELYNQRTAQHRVEESKEFFITSVKTHRPATSATIARWIKTALSKAGVDTTIFKAHSVRGAATSAAAEAGVSIPEILEAADWSNRSTFERFYYRPQSKTCFGPTVLQRASNLQSCYMRWNTPKYN